MFLTIVSGVLPSTHAQAMPMTTAMTHHDCCDSSDAQPSAERHGSSSSQDTHACDNCTQHCFAHAGLVSLSPNIQVSAYQGVFAAPVAQLLDASEGILRPPKT
ncbi:hypothetical protein [Idiomarina sp.]|uniref:hypothetical protein n=1 Tax=Idiomarina sp. TaxID=1874361 RepID=UPI0025C18B5F|nr:hypothetical protein [Idiomarina sp.]NQZ03344.1 hypothetical protein [Idiomarina sp.]